MDLVLAEAATPADFVAARTQTAFTLACHIVLASIGIGLPALTLFTEWLGHRRDDPELRRLARRWAKATGVLFAVGAVSGTVLSFEMGVLWPDFMGTFGEVIGLPFTIEGIVFFIEAIFIGIYLYGWDRLPPRTHMLAGVPIVLGGLASAFFVVTVNAWMNTPRGFRMSGSEVVSVRPLAAMFNPATPYEAAHLLLGSLMVCGFLIASVYAVALLRGRRDSYHRAAFTISFALGAIAAPVQVIVGDWAARSVAAHQPVKFAAMEGVLDTQAGAAMHLGGIASGGEMRHAITIPNGLSLLLRLDPGAVIRGVDAVPEGLRPPINVVHISFQLMVAAGVALLALAGWFALAWWRRRAPPHLPVVPPRRSTERDARGRRHAGRVDHHRGRTATLDRLRDDAHQYRRQPQARANAEPLCRYRHLRGAWSRHRSGAAAAVPNGRCHGSPFRVRRRRR